MPNGSFLVLGGWWDRAQNPNPGSTTEILSPPSADSNGNDNDIGFVESIGLMPGWNTDRFCVALFDGGKRLMVSGGRTTLEEVYFLDLQTGERVFKERMIRKYSNFPSSV